jgi:hypothetical protein
MRDDTVSFLRKQAWDYFNIHASQRMTVFNFYLVLSSLITTTYFASFKEVVDITPARPVLAIMLCLFAFIFQKLDQRNKTLIKNAERALKYFETLDHEPLEAKVFSQEEKDSKSGRLTGWRKLLFWQSHPSYSDCFNIVFAAFFALGLLCLLLPGLVIRGHAKPESHPPKLVEVRKEVRCYPPISLCCR